MSTNEIIAKSNTVKYFDLKKKNLYYSLRTPLNFTFEIHDGIGYYEKFYELNKALWEYSLLYIRIPNLPMYTLNKLPVLF